MGEDSFADFLDEEDEMDELDEAIQTYLEDEGIEAEAAIEIVGNDVDSYVDLVSMFVEETPDKINDLKEFLANEDMLNYSVLAHSTKSDSILVGAEPLSVIAKGHELEAKSGNVQYAKDNWDEFEKIWLEYYDKFKRFLDAIEDL